MFRRQPDRVPGARSLTAVEPPQRAQAKPPELAPASMAALRLGTSIVIKGHLSASEDLTIHGHFEGEIEVRAHTVTVGNGAEVEAPIHAKAVVIEGTVHGKVTATDRVEIRASGRLDGAVVAPRTAVAAGARVRGTVETRTVDGAAQLTENAGPVAVNDRGRAQKSPAA